MLAAIYDGSGLRLVNRVKPKVSSNEALLRVNAAAICGTDLRILDQGHEKIPRGVKPVLGHEFTGYIVEVGKNVNSLKLNERVVVVPNIGCGKCEQCLKGNNHQCSEYKAFGISFNGGFAEYVRLPAPAIQRGNIIPLPKSLSDKESVLIEPLSACYNALTSCSLKPGERVLIIGAGPMGILNLMLARLFGASIVIVSELSQFRSELAKKFGADAVISPTKVSWEEKIRRLTGGKGVDVAIVAVPVANAQRQAIEAVAIGGRVNFFGSLPKNEWIKNFPSNLLHRKHILVTGTSGASNIQFREVVNIVASKCLPLSNLITHQFSLGQIKEAVEVARSRQGLKIMIRP